MENNKKLQQEVGMVVAEEGAWVRKAENSSQWHKACHAFSCCCWSQCCLHATPALVLIFRRGDFPHQKEGRDILPVQGTHSLKRTMKAMYVSKGRGIYRHATVR